MDSALKPANLVSTSQNLRTPGYRPLLPSCGLPLSTASAVRRLCSRGKLLRTPCPFSFLCPWDQRVQKETSYAALLLHDVGTEAMLTIVPCPAIWNVIGVGVLSLV